VAYAAQLGRAPAHPESNPNREISRCFRSIVVVIVVIVVKPRIQNSLNTKNFSTIKYMIIENDCTKTNCQKYKKVTNNRKNAKGLPFSFLSPEKLNT
jgi:hypothetical protein